ncbi:MAG: hypothetical protein ACMVO3_22615 [Thalassobaculum sp.]
MAHERRLVTSTPQTWAGTIAEALVGTAGRSIIVGREWFRFKRGRGLVASDAAVAETRDELCIVRAGEVSQAEIAALHRMTGRRWSPLFNCLTAFAPFWEGRMSIVTPGDRDSIARRVVVSLVILVAVAVVLLFAAKWYRDSIVAEIRSEIETVRSEMDDIRSEQKSYHRSIVTHLGQIKARLPDQ